MRIKIQKKRPEQERVVLISFDTQGKKFNSDYERNKFFRGLHGWKQIIIKERKRYCYRRNGLLDEIPHVRIADSVFMIAMENMKRIIEYFNEWSDKVKCEMLEMMINEEKWKRLIDNQQKR